jgi:hypothetical protein
MNPIAESCGGGDGGRLLVPGSLRGYRTWRLRRRRCVAGQLPMTSITRRRVVWTPVLTASCNPRDIDRLAEPTADADHRAPERGCTCGIYAWYVSDDSAMLPGHAFGVIEATGVVLMGDRGFRAERARVVAVATRNRRLASACQRAGIAVFTRRRDLVRTYPPDDVSALIGDVARSERVPEQPARSAAACGIPLLIVSLRTALVVAAAVLLPALAALSAMIVAQLALVVLLAYATR